MHSRAFLARAKPGRADYHGNLNLFGFDNQTNFSKSAISEEIIAAFEYHISFLFPFYGTVKHNKIRCAKFFRLRFVPCCF